MATLLRALLLSTTIFAALAGSAQCSVDISVVPNNNNQVEIWLRPQMDFNTVFASISFTLQWMAGDNATLGSVTHQLQPYPFAFGTSGPVHSNGGFNYQVYFGSSLSSLADHGMSWTGGQELLLARINITSGNSSFQIVNDAFTNSVNGDFYISLAGNGCTGDIYSFSTSTMSTPAGSNVSVSPNPTSGPATIFVDMEDGSELHFELLDASGRRIYTSYRPGLAGRHEEHLDMRGLADGLYMLQVRMGDRTSTHRIVLASGTY